MSIYMKNNTEIYISKVIVKSIFYNTIIQTFLNNLQCEAEKIT